MGFAFPIAAALVALEAIVVVVYVLLSWVRPSANGTESLRHWRRCLILTSLLATLPVLLSIVEVAGDFIQGSVSLTPAAFTIVAMTFPALALNGYAAAKKQRRSAGFNNSL